MKGRLLGLFLATVHLCAWTCTDPAQQALMVDSLFADQEYLQFVCGSETCDKAVFMDRLEFRSEKLNDLGDVTGCFVEPQRKATNFFTGFFVVKDGVAALQFIFFGSGMGPTKRSRLGLRGVVSSEIAEHGDTVEHTFQWDGARYVETGSKSLKWE